MSVLKYATEFLEKSRFATGHNADEGMKIQTFINGLGSEIQSKILMGNFKTLNSQQRLDEVIELAFHYEKD